MADGNTTTKRRRARMAPAITTPDPIEIAMEAEAAASAPVGEASRLLAEQRRLVRWQIASERMGVALKFLTGLAGVAFALFLAAMAWQASRADGLVIKPFSVPPDLAQRGLTGEAVASQLLDRLDTIEGKSRSSVITKRVSADWGDDVSIAIPQTGVSLDQLEQWLRDKLGHQTSVTGEVVRDHDGRLALNVRVGSRSLPAALGRDEDIPQMLQATAEAMYARDIPQNYLMYLNRTGRAADLLAFAKGWAASQDDPQIKARAWHGMGLAYAALGQGREAADAYRMALFLDPATSAGAASLLNGIEENAGRWEASFDYAVQSGTRAVNDPLYTRASKASIALANAGLLATLRHDHLTALAKRRAWVEGGAIGFRGQTRQPIVQSLAALHETGAALRESVAEQTTAGPWTASQRAALAELLGDWPAVIAASDEHAAELTTRADGGREVLVWRWRKASALARTGRLDEARAVIEPTPLDCVPCLMARGMAAAYGGQAAASDHWYREASRLSPRRADAPMQWGQMLAARGERSRAVAQFAEATRRAPRWADPLEAWGELLLAAGDPRGAAAKFAQATPLAPRWGRLHLMHGEALAAQGNLDQAEAKWRAAAGMDLTQAERAELQTVMKRPT